MSNNTYSTEQGTNPVPTYLGTGRTELQYFPLCQHFSHKNESNQIMIERKEEISLAMFGVVAPEDDSAMMITQEQRQVSSSEDLGTSGFDEEHVELEQFVQSVPKIELHVHLDGSFEPAQMWSHLLEDPKLLQCFPVEKKLPWAKRSEPPLPLR